MPQLINPFDDRPPPRGNVLLLTCMDLRLLDNVVEFMTRDNLTNRYDHVTFAGASLGALGNAPYPAWRQVFFDHLGGAIKLHDVRDIYILEHRDCGAYSKIFQIAPDFGTSEEEQNAEAQLHQSYANVLESQIHAWFSEWQSKQTALECHKHNPKCRCCQNANPPGCGCKGESYPCPTPEKKELHITKFLMDLRGQVWRFKD